MTALRSILEALNEMDAWDGLAAHWEESVAGMPEGVPFFLEPAGVHEGVQWGGLDQEIEPVLIEAAGRIASDPGLRLLAWHCCRRLFDWTDSGGFGQWPSFERALGELSGCFYLLVGMAMVPRVRECHGKLGVSEEITRATCMQLRSFNENHVRGTGGRLGLYRSQLFWLANYVDGSLFRLGRFEYRLEPRFSRVWVFRHGATGNTVALSEDGLCFDQDGYGVEAGEVGAWTASLKVTDMEARGYPIDPVGKVVRREVVLSLADWECVVKPGDHTLDMHIPAGGGMTPDLCVDSMRRAVDFFAEHFPEKPFRSISCTSWIFGPQLEEILSPDANLVRYMRELYLYPLASEPNAGLWFIFFREDFNPASLPRDTSVQRAAADYLAAGKRWRIGGMFTLVDDLPQYGSRHYRVRWSEVERLLMCR